MHLKSLTLRGFKSFASATTLRFEPGITCVVGPNGSGKSNILDALRWVMGEQGAKGLRGGKMEDVIFAGTSGRSPLGRAEVTLTIDNSDGALPIEYSEVSITRRMFRDGAGEYEINGNTCRLMDVQELLSDSGIGREMHVIVGQGQLSAILESKPEERRAFIEEAAGVLKHRRRREKAVRKLESMQANLARLNDLTAELRRQLKPLGRQAEMARRAQTIQADLRDARLRLLADELVARRSDLEQQTANENEILDRQREVTESLHAATERLNTHENELNQLEPALHAANEGWFRLSALAERMDSTIKIAAERSRHLKQPQQIGSGEDPDEMEARADELAEEEAELLMIVEETSLNLETAAENLADCETAAKEAEQRHIDQVRAVADRREGLARLRGQVETLSARVESVTSESNRLQAAIDDATARADEAQAQFDTAESQICELDTTESELNDHHDRAQAALQTASQRVQELVADEQSCRERVVSLSARIEALTMGLERKDGAAWINEHAAEAVVGTLSNEIVVQAGYETAIATALGALSDAVVVRQMSTAHEITQQLKASDGGRVAVVVANDDAQSPENDELSSYGESVTGCVSLPADLIPASELVTAPSSLRSIIDGILANCAVAEDLNTAAAISNVQPTLRIVTMMGDLVGEGWLIGGTEQRPSTLEITASIAAAEKELAECTSRGEEVGAALAGARADEDARREIAEAALAALNESDANLGAVYENLGRLGHQARSARNEADRLDRQRVHVLHQREEAIAALTAMRERLANADRDTAMEGECDSPADDLVAERDRATAALTAARAAEMEARLASRSAQERALAMRGKADAVRRAAAAEREKIARQQRAIEQRAEAAAVADLVAEYGHRAAERIAVAVQDAARWRQNLETQRAEKTRDTTHLRSIVADLATEKAQLTDAAHRDEIAKAQAALRIEQLEEHITDQFAISADDLINEYGPDVPLPPTDVELAEYEQAKERGEQVIAPQPLPFDRSMQQARAKKAEKELAALGRVNPLALEEFAALEERYSFLSTQLEDVKSARKDLLDVVDEVDARILQVFTDAYNDVEREFVDVFTTLFPGGEGRLVLTDPSDMLTTGIDVEARPPGKKVKRLSLLSGGEKSLTAVAMLVAIFRARPSPFYVMDEVEAALDDTNLRRLITLFEQLREKSQLIVVTHQKPTMEVADALYGVSMRGDGITQVISQRMRGQDMALPKTESE